MTWRKHSSWDVEKEQPQPPPYGPAWRRCACQEETSLVLRGVGDLPDTPVQVTWTNHPQPQFYSGFQSAGVAVPLCSVCPRDTQRHTQKRPQYLDERKGNKVRTCEVKKGKRLSLSGLWFFYDPMGYSPPGSSVHGILQAKILEWVSIPSSRGSSWPRDQIQVSYVAGRFFTVWVTRKAQKNVWWIINGIV